MEQVASCPACGRAHAAFVLSSTVAPPPIAYMLLLHTYLPAQGRAPPASLEGLPDIPDGSYHYVFLHVFFVTVTHRCVMCGMVCCWV